MKKTMKLIAFGLLITAVLLAGCSPEGEVTNEPAAGSEAEDANLQESEDSSSEASTSSGEPVLIEGELKEFLPEVDQLEGTYNVGDFPITNQSLIDNWGDFIQEPLNQTERLEGIGAFYDRESEIGTPSQYFVVIENFASAAGAEDFYNYDFSQEFRNSGFPAEGISLDPADDARFMEKEDYFGDDSETIALTIEFWYKNTFCIVEARGLPDEVSEEYLRGMAELLLSKLSGN